MDAAAKPWRGKASISKQSNKWRKRNIVIRFYPVFLVLLCHKGKDQFCADHCRQGLEFTNLLGFENVLLLYARHGISHRHGIAMNANLEAHMNVNRLNGLVTLLPVKPPRRKLEYDGWQYQHLQHWRKADTQAW